MKNLSFDSENCPIARISKVLQGKWSMVIIYVLLDVLKNYPFVSTHNLVK